MQTAKQQVTPNSLWVAVRRPYAHALAIASLFLFVVSVSAFTGAFSFTRGRAAAATNGTLNFQARLLDTSGATVPDGSYNIQFNLYDGGTAGGPAGPGAANAGTNYWTESRLVSASQGVTVKNGYFSATLGSVTPFGTGINWDQELWLGMTVRGTGSCAFGACTPTDAEMTPRFKLTAVPYAFRAGAVTDATGNAFTADDLIQKGPSSVQAVNLALAAIRLNQTGAGGLLQLQGSGSDVFTVDNTGGTTIKGAVLAKNTTDSAAAFEIQDSGSNSYLKIDTLGAVSTFGSSAGAARTILQGGTNGVQIASGADVTIGAVDANATLLVLDTKNTAGDPAGTNGAMYYNSSLNKFRCFEGGAWADCLGGGGYDGTSASFIGGLQNVAANQTALPIENMVFTSSVAISNIAASGGYTAPADGSFRSCLVMNNAAVTAGTIGLRWRVNGVSVGAPACAMAAGGTSRQSSTVLNPGVVTFNAGDIIDLAFDTSNTFLPTGSNDFTVYWNVEYTGSGGGGTAATTLQDVYDASVSATIQTANNKDLTISLTDTTIDSDFIVNVESGSTSRFVMQDAGVETLSIYKTGDIVTSGGLTVGASSSTTAGTIRWTGTDFEGYDGSSWISLTGGGGGGGGSGQNTVTVVKSVNETVNGSNVLQDDDELLFAIGPNEQWTYRFVIQAISGGTPDIQFAVGAPSGATCRATANDVESAVSVGQLACGATSGLMAGDALNNMYEVTGSVSNGATAGNVALRWAQNTSNASNTIVSAGSFVHATRSIGAGSAGQPFAQSGNSFGTLATLGTSDNNALSVITNNTERLRVLATGETRFADDVIANGVATGTTGTTAASPGTSTTTVVLAAAGAFANDDVIYIDNTGQDYYTRIISGGGTTTLTVSPAVSYDASAPVTKYTVQNIGATTTDYASQANRFFQGYFLGGVVVGAGSTTLSDGSLSRTVGDISITPGSGGELKVAGTINATTFVGDGSLLTNIDGASIVGASIADSSLSANVSLLTGAQTFSGAKTFSALASFTGAGTALSVTNDASVGGTLSAGNVSISGNTTLGDGSGDTLTVNAGTATIANDLAVTLSGGLNGLNFDNNTLSIDAASDRIGIGTAAPSTKLHVVYDGVSEAAPGTTVGKLELRNTFGNNIYDVLSLDRAVVGDVGANGVGLGILFNTENNAGTMVNSARIASTLQNSVAGSEEGSIIIQTRTAGAALAELARFSGRTFTNGGATVNTTLAVANDADGGALGAGLAASASVDIYTSIAVAQSTAGQNITLPTPTANTAYGRILYLSNIGSVSFTLGSGAVTVNAGTTATLIWSNTTSGDSWQFAGADGNGILNQNTSDQTANFRISGTGRANTSLTTPLVDSISGALSIGTSTATGITIGGAATTGTVAIANGGVANTVQIGNTTGGVSQTINIGNNATASSSTTLVLGSTIGGATTLQSSGGVTVSQNLSVNGNTAIGNQTTDRLTITSQILGTNALVFQGATDNGFATTFTIAEPTANNSIIIPNAGGTVAVSASGGIALSAAGDISLSSAVSFATSITTPTLTSTAGLSISSGGAGALTLDSASNTIVIAANDTVLQRAAAGNYTIDLTNAAATTLVLDNSAAGAAALNLNDGALQTAGTVRLTNNGTLQNITGLTIASGGAAITGASSFGDALNLNGNTAIGNQTTDRLTITSQILGTNALVFQGATDNGFATTFTIAEPTTNNTITVPNASGTVALIGSSVVQADATTNSSIFINKTGATGNILTLQDNGTGVFTISNDGSTQIAITSTSALDIQNTGGTDMFTVDTSGAIVRVGSATLDGTATILVTDAKNTTGDPVGGSAVIGAQYYNQFWQQYRCYRDSTWETCGTTPVDRAFAITDEFMSGYATCGAATALVGTENWACNSSGTATIAYNNGTIIPSANRPGIMRITTAAANGNGTTLSLNGSTSANGSVLIAPLNRVIATVGQGTTITNNRLRVGLHSQGATNAQPVSGVWWEADATTNTLWRYCYGNGATATCANATGFTITANTMYNLDILVTATGTGASAVTFRINGTAFTVTGVTVDTTNRVSPAISCFNSAAGARECYADYYQFSGVTSTRR